MEAYTQIQSLTGQKYLELLTLLFQLWQFCSQMKKIWTFQIKTCSFNKINLILVELYATILTKSFKTERIQTEMRQIQRQKCSKMFVRHFDIDWHTAKNKMVNI
ncbi:hypothetical protein NQ317_002364 [Molorchus minor]|uniref:Uncharacterized protein n=1 Tax=Molorchus minor TaxID=1323400 RepID=A0ABQ9JWV0_9CUCU|nr:hypothetical protein NQ317_002364 [Molorchus minor]